MMNFPLVSVIIPVYNVEQYLTKCIESVLSQSFCDYELMLVDDGSTDNSGKICDGYAEKDNRIRVFHKSNGGLSSARNLGVDRAKGVYVFFLDSDDYWCDACVLQTFVDAAEKYGADVIRGEYKPVDLSGKDFPLKRDIREKMTYCGKVLGNDEFLRHIIHGEFFTPMSMYRKIVIEDIRMDENLYAYEDIDFAARLYIHPLKCLYLPVVFYAYRKRSDSLSYCNDDRRLRDSFAMCRRFHDNASGAAATGLEEYYHYYSVMMYYWTLQTVADMWYGRRKEIVAGLGLESLRLDVRSWLHEYHVKAFSLVFYVPAWLGIIYISYRDRMKNAIYRLLAQVRKFVKS